MTEERSDSGKVDTGRRLILGAIGAGTVSSQLSTAEEGASSADVSNVNVSGSRVFESVMYMSAPDKLRIESEQGKRYVYFGVDAGETPINPKRFVLQSADNRIRYYSAVQQPVVDGYARVAYARRQNPVAGNVRKVHDGVLFKLPADVGPNVNLGIDGESVEQGNVDGVNSDRSGAELASVSFPDSITRQAELQFELKNPSPRKVTFFVGLNVSGIEESYVPLQYSLPPNSTVTREERIPVSRDSPAKQATLQVVHRGGTTEREYDL